MRDASVIGATLPPRERTGGHALAAVLFLMLLAAALRGWRLGDRSFWFDEAFGWRLTRFSTAELISRAARDNNPPLYYLALKLWSAIFGESALALRSLSVVSGAATVGAVYLFVREAFRGADFSDGARQRSESASWTGLLAASFVALSAFQVRWGWEARMYSMGTALAALSSWALWRALNSRPALIRPWYAYAFFALLFLYTHTYALFSIGAQWAFVAGALWWKARRSDLRDGFVRQARGAAASAAIIGLGCLPWAPSFVAQCRQVRADFWTGRLTLEHFIHSLGEMLVGPDAVPPGEWACPAGALLLGAVLALSLWRATVADVYLFAACALPLAGSLVCSATFQNIFCNRYLIFAHLFLLISAARLVARIPWRGVRQIAALAAVANFAVIHGEYWSRLDVAGRPGMRAIAARLAARRGRDEPLLTSSVFLYLPLLFHTDDRQNCHLLRSEEPLRHYHGTAAMLAADVAELNDVASRGASRLWLVDKAGDELPRLGPAWREADHWSFPEVYPAQGWILLVEYVREPASNLAVNDNDGDSF